MMSLLDISEKHTVEQKVFAEIVAPNFPDQSTDNVSLVFVGFQKIVIGAIHFLILVSFIFIISSDSL